jgi:CelD/BcsL family acetyltransferase involved in cellulose biosynthesis
MSPVRIEEVTSAERLKSLGPEWSDLWMRCPDATPFQSPEWLLAWWRHFGNNNLWTLSLHQGRRLVGLAPLFVHGHRDHSLCQLSLIGTGISDYLDFLLEPEIALIGTEMILRHLALQRSRWDLCDFQELRAESPLVAVRATTELHTRILTMGVSPVLSLPKTAEAFRASLTSMCRRNLRRALRLLGECGELHFESPDAERRPEFLEAFFRLHQARWNQRNLPGVLATPGIQAFHQEAAAGLMRRGCLRLYGVRHNGRVIAVLYGFARNGRVYAYLAGFDPALAQYSPGTLLTNHAIEEAIRNGDREYDFLRGEEAHKYVWGARDRSNYQLLVWHPASRWKDKETPSPGLSTPKHAKV